MNSLSRSLFQFLSSLKLAVILLIIFAGVLSWATFYESSAGTEEAQRIVYQNRWFDVFLFVLGLNVLCAALYRLPWKKHHTGFVITHAGILIILVGSFITRKWGVEGQLMLREGENADSIQLNDVVLTVKAPRLNVQQEFDPWFLNSPIPTGKEIRYPVGNTGVVCFVDQYFMNPQTVEQITNDAPAPNPAVQISLSQPGDSAAALQEWLFAADSRRNVLDLGIASVRFQALANSEEIYRRLNSPTLSTPGSTNAVNLFLSKDNLLYYTAVNSSGHSATGAMVIGGSFDTTWNSLLLKIDAFYPNARVTREIIDAGAASPQGHNNPILHVRLENKGEKAADYVPLNSPVSLTVGGEPCEVEFGQKEYPMNFTLQLLDFRAPRNPGTNQPARFESQVKLIDPARKVDQERLISMNNPLDYGKFRVFQASYIEGQNGQKDISIFSVAFAPGTPIIYVGSLVLVLGMVVMFVPNPWSRRKAVGMIRS